MNFFSQQLLQPDIIGGDANDRAAFWRVKYIRNVSFSEMERNSALIMVQLQLLLLSH